MSRAQRPLLIAVVIIGILLAILLVFINQRGGGGSSTVVNNSSETNTTTNVTIQQDNEITTSITADNSVTQLSQTDIDLAVQNLFQLTAVATLNVDVDVDVNVGVEVGISVPTAVPTATPSIIGYWLYGFSNYLELGADGSARFPSITSTYYGSYRYDGTNLTVYGENDYGSITLRFRVQRLTADQLVVLNLDTNSPTNYTRVY